MAARKTAGTRGRAREKCGPGGEAGATGAEGYGAEMAGQVEKLCRLGASDGEVADFFGVEPGVLAGWMGAHAEFAEGVRRGRMLADAEVADRLYLRARGYTHEAVKIMQRAGEPVIVPYVEHYPPDTTACIFWLKNRRPDLWRDKVSDDGGGRKGGAMELTVGAEALAAIQQAAIQQAAGHAALVTGPGGDLGKGDG